MTELAQHYLADVLQRFRDYKTLAERAGAQISDEDFFAVLDPWSNSIAVNMKHMAGNMLSRWTDFLTSDGEKPERDRDIEFVMLPGATRPEMIAYWERGWRCVFDAVEPLKPNDLLRTITIRGQEHTVMQAINRQVAHYAYHVGQIVYLAKHFKSSDWQSLSVPQTSLPNSTFILNRRRKSLRPLCERAVMGGCPKLLPDSSSLEGKTIHEVTRSRIFVRALRVTSWIVFVLTDALTKTN